MVELDVGRKDELVTVESDRGQVLFTVKRFSSCRLGLLDRPVAPKRLGARIDNQASRVAIENAHGLSAHCHDEVTEADNRWDAKRAGEDSRMRIDTALFRGKSQDTTTVHHRGVGRTEITCDDHVLRFWTLLRVDRVVSTRCVEIVQHSLTDVFEISGALRKVRIWNAPHRLQEVVHHRVESILSVDPTFVNRTDDFIDKRAVLEHHQMSLKNPRLCLA